LGVAVGFFVTRKLSSFGRFSAPFHLDFFYLQSFIGAIKRAFRLIGCIGVSLIHNSKSLTWVIGFNFLTDIFSILDIV
jgi:hypothetical protein